MGHKAFDLQGKTFGRLTVIGRDWSAAKQATWLCRCECGNEVSVWSRSLCTGNTRSCGCLRSERTTECKTIHGKHGTPEYNIWKGMNGGRSEIRRFDKKKDTGYLYKTLGKDPYDAAARSPDLLWMANYWDDDHREAA